MSDYRKRMKVEYEQLAIKIIALDSFINSDKFDCLPDDERDDLLLQCAHMEGYATTLESRILRAA
jgi:hypothetical protein